jgi:hypothetical protein
MQAPLVERPAAFSRTLCFALRGYLGTACKSNNAVAG